MPNWCGWSNWWSNWWVVELLGGRTGFGWSKGGRTRKWATALSSTTVRPPTSSTTVRPPVRPPTSSTTSSTTRMPVSAKRTQSIKSRICPCFMQNLFPNVVNTRRHTLPRPPLHPPPPLRLMKRVSAVSRFGGLQTQASYEGIHECCIWFREHKADYHLSWVSRECDESNGKVKPLESAVHLYRGSPPRPYPPTPLMLMMRISVVSRFEALQTGKPGRRAYMSISTLVGRLR